MSFNTDFLEIIYSEHSLEGKLRLSEYLGAINSRFDMGVYGCEALERHLINCALVELDCSVYNKGSASLKENSLHIISEPYLTGGHTRLCERLSTMEEVPPDLLITYHNDENYIASQKLSTHFDNTYRVGPNLSMVERLLYFLDIIILYERCVLHIHQNDICAVVALGLLKKKRHIQIFFVNHADHTFSFGESIIDVKLQISHRGYLVDKLRGNAGYLNSFIGIPIDIQSRALITNENIHSFVMAGASWKMKPTNYGSAPKLVDCILRADSNNTFVVIGPKVTDYWWWKVHLKYKSRVKFYRALPYEDYIEVIKSSSGVVDSIPGGGGTAFVEMYLLGLRPFGISSGVGGYTPLDLVKANESSDILTKKIPKDLYHKVIEVHGFENVKHRFLSSLSGVYSEIPDSLVLNNNDLKSFRHTGKLPFDHSFIALSHLMDSRVKRNLLVLLVKFFSKKSLFFYYGMNALTKAISLMKRVISKKNCCLI